LHVLSRLERATLVAVVVVGVLVLTAMVVAALRWQHIKAWVDAPAVLDAHRTMQVLDLPVEFTADTTLTACDPSDPVRCAWTDQTAPDAVEALVGALRDAGLKPGPVVCDSVALPALWRGGVPECGAPLELSGATAWAVATARSPVGGVPLGRTAAWVMWDRTSMSSALLDRLVPELDQPAPDIPLSPAEVTALMPARFRFAGTDDCSPFGDAALCSLVAELDVSDLGADPVPALVAELTDAGLYVTAGDADPGSSTPVEAVRFFRDEQGRRHGLLVVVHRVDGDLRGEVWPW
jgi:hypothetical protein